MKNEDLTLLFSLGCAAFYFLEWSYLVFYGRPLDHKEQSLKY